MLPLRGNRDSALLLPWVFVAAHGLSLVAERGGCFSLQCVVFSCFRAQALGMWPQSLWCTGLVAPRHVELSRTRNWTHVLCIARQILSPWATREVQAIVSWLRFLYPCFPSPVLRLLVTETWSRASAARLRWQNTLSLTGFFYVKKIMTGSFSPGTPYLICFFHPHPFTPGAHARVHKILCCEFSRHGKWLEHLRPTLPLKDLKIFPSLSVH